MIEVRAVLEDDVADRPCGVARARELPRRMGRVPEVQRVSALDELDLGELRPATTEKHDDFAGALVLCPPSAVDDRWSRRFPDPVSAFASGWMRIKGRIRQAGVELPLVISDHADWPELLDTIVETGAEDVWVTHGRDDALVYELTRRGLKARALALVGFEDEGE